jgi:hypothetical protein
MANESMMAGLELKASRVEWNWEDLKEAVPSDSLKRGWWLAEYLPLKRLTYNNATMTTRYEFANDLIT